MSNLVKMTEEFKELIGEYLFRTKAQGFWEVKGTYIEVSGHNCKNVMISGYLDPNAPEYPNHVAYSDKKGNRTHVPIEWLTIVSKGVKSPKKWIPYGGTIQQRRDKHRRVNFVKRT